MLSAEVSGKRHHGSELPGTHILFSFLGLTVGISVVDGESKQLWALEQVLVPILFLWWSKRLWKKKWFYLFLVPSGSSSIIQDLNDGQMYPGSHGTTLTERPPNSWTQQPAMHWFLFSSSKAFPRPMSIRGWGELSASWSTPAQWETLKISCRHSSDWKAKLPCKLNMSTRPR